VSFAAKRSSKAPIVLMLVARRAGLSFGQIVTVLDLPSGEAEQ
jgi:hypothetical protein